MALLEFSQDTKTNTFILAKKNAVEYLMDRLVKTSVLHLIQMMAPSAAECFQTEG